MAVRNTFVGELKAGLGAVERFTIVDTEFDRSESFPQLLISYAGLSRDRAIYGERVPQCEIRVAIGYAQDIEPDTHEEAEDIANDLFDACRTIPFVLAFDYNGVMRFEPLDGREAEFYGLDFLVMRAGGVHRG